MERTSQSSPNTPYPNHTIIEALCELHFTSNGSSLDEDWDGRWFGRLLNNLGQNYDMEPKLTGGFQVQSLGGQTKISSKTSAHMIYLCKTALILFSYLPGNLR